MAVRTFMEIQAQPLTFILKQQENSVGTSLPKLLSRSENKGLDTLIQPSDSPTPLISQVWIFEDSLKLPQWVVGDKMMEEQGAMKNPDKTEKTKLVPI